MKIDLSNPTPKLTELKDSVNRVLEAYGEGELQCAGQVFEQLMPAYAAYFARPVAATQVDQLDDVVELLQGIDYKLAHICYALGGPDERDVEVGAEDEADSEVPLITFLSAIAYEITKPKDEGQ